MRMQVVSFAPSRHVVKYLLGRLLRLEDLAFYNIAKVCNGFNLPPAPPQLDCYNMTHCSTGA
jgi:hypothetical protein